MKKIKFIIGILVCSFCLLTFTSCTKDIETSLKGTKWEAESEGATSILKFSSSTFTISVEGVEIVSGTYIYTPPTVTMTAEGDTEVMTVVDQTELHTSDPSLVYELL